MVGIGPGGPLDRTRRAEAAIAESRVVVGYTLYLEMISDLTDGKELIGSGMMQEVERCREALRRAANGDAVALVSSGDPGVYGMAGLALELAAAERIDAQIEIIPGITSANAAAARFGAPLMLDYAVISLSDLLAPWETILARISALAASDLVVAIYNPKSRSRTTQIVETAAVFGRHRPGTTPVGIATAVGSPEERLVITDLNHMLDQEIGMRSVVIIGNSTSKIIDGWFITPRGYDV